LASRALYVVVRIWSLGAQRGLTSPFVLEPWRPDLSACLRDRSLLVAVVFRDVYVAARSWVPCPLAAGSHGVIWRLWGFWGVFWRSCGGPVRACFGRLGPFWAVLGSFWAASGRLGNLGLSWSFLGGLLGAMTTPTEPGLPVHRWPLHGPPGLDERPLNAPALWRFREPL